jgi:DNA-binding XRE family transcriptional regulator
LKDKTRKPGKTPVSVETKNKLCSIACNEKPKDAAHWSVRSLAKQVGVSKSTVNNILRERGIKPHLVETFRFSKDEKFEEKLKDVAGLYMNSPEYPAASQGGKKRPGRHAVFPAPVPA